MRYLSVTSIIFLFFLSIITNTQEVNESGSPNISQWLKDYSGVLVAGGTLALAGVTFILLLLNRKQLKYIQREHSLKNILEHIYAEIDQNLNIHEQIFNKFRSIYNNIESFEDLASVENRSFRPERIDIAPFDTTIWDGVKLKISITDLNKIPIDLTSKMIKDIFKKGYPFCVVGYDVGDPPNHENLYHRLKATYSRIKIQNEFVYRLRYAISAQPDQKIKLHNYLSVGNFKELLHDLVRAKSYLTQAKEKLK